MTILLIFGVINSFMFLMLMSAMVVLLTNVNKYVEAQLKAHNQLKNVFGFGVSPAFTGGEDGTADNRY